MTDDMKLLWGRVVERAKTEWNSSHADQLIDSATPVRLDSGRLTLRFNTGWARDWVEARYLSDLKIIVQELIPGVHDLQLICKTDHTTTQGGPSVNGNDLSSGPAGKTLQQTYLTEATGDEPVERTDRNGGPGQSTGRLKQSPMPPLRLNPKYTFETFIVGPSNRFAQAASLAVAEDPAGAYNPLFLYGGVGLGKTHLMQAISHYVRLNHRRMVVAYVSSETFTNELIHALQRRGMPEFRRKYRDVDVLLIDDIQFVAGKEQTQEEFFHTFNALYEAEKQIIISSDRPPKEIPTLEERLRSRFEWGLTTDIQPPDLETRIAILQNKAHQDGLTLPNETCMYIAETVQSNIRELEGALIQVVAYANIQNTLATPDIAEQALSNLVARRRNKIITIQAIQEAVGSHYNIAVSDMISKKRTQAIAFPRQIAMYLSRSMTDASLPKIGEEFGGRDHSTVIHACDKIEQLLEKDPVLAQILREIEQRIRNE